MIVTVPGAVGFDDGSVFTDQRGWWTCCPDCGQSGLLASHKVTFPWDEATGYSVPNVTPSCVCAAG